MEQKLIHTKKIQQQTAQLHLFNVIGLELSLQQASQVQSKKHRLLHHIINDEDSLLSHSSLGPPAHR